MAFPRHNYSSFPLDASELRSNINGSLPLTGILTRPDGAATTTNLVALKSGFNEILTGANCILPPNSKPGAICFVAITDASNNGGAVYAPPGGVIVNAYNNTTQPYYRIINAAMLICKGNNNWLGYNLVGFSSDLTLNFTNFSLNTGSIDLTSSGGSVKSRLNVQPKTSNYAVQYTDTNCYLTNLGAVGEVDFTLPNPINSSVNVIFTFAVMAGQTFKIIASNGAIIRNGASVSSANGSATNATAGSIITLANLDGAHWDVIGTPVGTWTLA